MVPRHEVRTEGHVLHYSIVRPEAANTDDFPVFGNEQAGPPQRRSRYELHLPYTIALRVGWGGDKGMVYFFAVPARRRATAAPGTSSSAATTTSTRTTR